MNITEIHRLYLKNPIICTDTRDVQENAIFFALKGTKFNGNVFAKTAIQKGCRYAIIDDKNIKHKNCILVKDVLSTLQKLAKYHRKQYNIPVIGLTGTNGKTTSKELVAHILMTKYNCIATQGNFNNHIGVPLTILRIKENTDIAVIEIGANHVGEIDFLCNIACPTHGSITNIGRAHLDGFKSSKGVLKAKAELYHYLNNNNGVCFINNDDKILKNIDCHIEQISYGKTGACLGKIENITPFMQLKYKQHIINSNLIGSYQFYNIMLAICISSYFKIPTKDIKKAIQNYAPKNNRSQIIKTDYNLIIADAYNANPSSMIEMLKSFCKQQYENKLCILGDMLELGKASKNEHKIIRQFVKKQNINTIFIGENFYLPNDEMSFIDKSEFIEHIQEAPIKNHTILLKGSRGLQLEELITNL
ncbi:MAG: UDP-N-acetylmuramoyl-tripeptide--D-alanyl-D-alanine ligase [Bacteroidota bacterium]|nr:UDP-N-acetylmuramoyl-tripeptide--D-alanyl-D-alanine ligase [Bacteroidota bacterium]